MARLLLVWQSRSGRTATLKDALLAGIASVPDTELRVRSATEAGLDDVLWAEGYLFGCAEHFGHMAGLFHDFLERCYEGALDQVSGRPYALFIAAGNDGRGAERALQRVLAGWRLKAVQPALIWRASSTPEAPIDEAHTLGQSLALGLQMGIW